MPWLFKANPSICTANPISTTLLKTLPWKFSPISLFCVNHPSSGSQPQLPNGFPTHSQCILKLTIKVTLLKTQTRSYLYSVQRLQIIPHYAQSKSQSSSQVSKGHMIPIRSRLPIFPHFHSATATLVPCCSWKIPSLLQLDAFALAIPSAWHMAHSLLPSGLHSLQCPLLNEAP